MGYTLVARFQESDFEVMVSTLSMWGGTPVNKIPFGRGCDRNEANTILPYHMTILHWSRSDDVVMLPKMKNLVLPSMTVTADSVRVLPAAENSSLLYLQIKPTVSYERWCHAQGKAIGVCFDLSFLHVTIAVSKNTTEIEQLAKYLKLRMKFPFELRIRKLELYHIWNPIRLVETWEKQLD